VLWDTKNYFTKYVSSWRPQ